MMPVAGNLKVPDAMILVRIGRDASSLPVPVRHRDWHGVQLATESRCPASDGRRVAGFGVSSANWGAIMSYYFYFPLLYVLIHY
jgi:hypothetical protein